MTRKEQIHNASMDYDVNPFDFKDGAMWADSHPYWHDIKDNPQDLPNIGDEVLVTDGVTIKIKKYDGKFYDIDCTGKRWNQTYVVAWTELPKYK